jgi:hypothetical protein
VCASSVADDERLNRRQREERRELAGQQAAHNGAPAGSQGLDRAAGYRYAVSILQAEFSLTQVLHRPQTGRVFFEKIVRENLDICVKRKNCWQTPGRPRLGHHSSRSLNRFADPVPE